ncbi:MAG: hypothetical protein R3C11_29600 [Planctomycetaceae bacterium]
MIRFAFSLLVLGIYMLSGCSDMGEFRLEGIHDDLLMDDMDGEEWSTGKITDPETGTAFGGPSTESLFDPYEGNWMWVDSKLKFNDGRADLEMTGHIMRFPHTFSESGPVSEIRLCQARKIDGGIATEGWHHEDRHDPGDMSRAL